MASNGFQSSYSNERPVTSTGSSSTADADIASDPASSSFFFNDYKNSEKHEDLKQMLDGNKDGLKLEAMKRIIGMVAKGKDASDLFPAVVKNVVSKNIEVKKLVYVYLTRYAEEQQDLALLSISTFQRALKDPNQLIRASALRVLSSIRVPMIVPIMMLAIKESVMDMSPYVRKTAAHAIPKLYSLDPEQKDLLLEVIEKLLADKTTLVAGSAIQAFEEVCPERIDLIHKNFRKLCTLLVDVEEWGQVVIINMLTRYSRSQFVDPNQGEGFEEKDAPFYNSDDDENAEKKEKKEKERKSEESKAGKNTYVMDADHRLLLKTCKPLLNSRNAAVVLAVAQLYHHCAPRSEASVIAKALIRLLRSYREVQYIVLSNIATMSVKRKSIFEPFLKSFYVRSNDAAQSKLLKLEILTNLATETNISTILREFQTYVTSSDQEFAAATIQAIGRCASSITEITDACLNGLVGLLSNRNEAVVGESVVIIKKLLQMQPTEHQAIISHLARLADTITVPMARASILWLIGEYSDRIPKIAPDVLRKMAKNFMEEQDIVKLQILNLAAKLCITNPKQTKLLCQYVLNLAKYDQNYDIRDRARFLRPLILPQGDKVGLLAKHVKKIFLATKPAPVLESRFKDRDQYQLSTLSHMLNCKAAGYHELPEWPLEAPDPSVRNVEVPVSWLESKTTGKKKKQQEKQKKTFYSESESSSEGESGSSSSSEGSESGSSTTTSGPDSRAQSDSEGASGIPKTETDTTKKSSSESKKSSAEKKVKGKAKKAPGKEKSSSEDSEESSDESSEENSSSEESEEEESESEKTKKKADDKKKTAAGTTSQQASAKKDSSDLLLDFDTFGGSGGDPSSLLSPESMNMLVPLASSEVKRPKPVPYSYADMLGPTRTLISRELLNKITGGGLSATYKFTRMVINLFSSKHATVEITFTNNNDTPISNIRMSNKKVQPGMDVFPFPEIGILAPKCEMTIMMGINFNDTTQPAQFDLETTGKRFTVSITAPVGELLQPMRTLTENEFNSLQGKLTGMNETIQSVVLTSAENATSKVIINRVYEVANVLQVPISSQPKSEASATTSLYCFASKTASGGSDTLVTVKVDEATLKATVKVNCDKMVIGSMLAKDIKQALAS